MDVVSGTVYGSRALTYLSLAFLVLATGYAAIVSFGRRRDSETPSWIFPGPAGCSLRRAISAASIALVAGLVAWMAFGLRASTRPGSRFMIPDGYVGWVKLEFGVPGAPPLPMEGGKYVVRFTPSGVLKTSTAEEAGSAKDYYYYYSDGRARELPGRASGAASLIWGHFHSQASGSSGKHSYEEFFVGTEQQFKEQASPGNQAGAASAQREASSPAGRGAHSGDLGQREQNGKR